MNKSRKEYVLIFFAVIFLSSTVTQIESFVKPANEGIITISVKHHNFSDLTIDVGQIDVDSDYKPSKGYDLGKAKRVKVWNREKIAEDTPITTLTRSLSELGMTENPPPERKKSAWFVNIVDHGKFRYEPDEDGNRSEKAIEESINYLVEFSVTINGITYTCREHPYFDNGGTARGEIYGLEEEISIDNGQVSGKVNGKVRGKVSLDFSNDYENAMVVIGISKFAYRANTPNMARDAWNFYITMKDLAYDGFIPQYESFIAIDDSYQPTPTKYYAATHAAIYWQTVDSMLVSADAHTGGDDQTIVFITSHGMSFPQGFYLYDTWWWGHFYGAGDLAVRIKGQTSEGTDMWVWLACCYSANWTPPYQSTYHLNHVVYWAYDHVSYADTASVEIPEFERMVRMYYSLIETIFGYVNYKYHSIHGGDYYMTQRDYIPGYFCLYD
ncbi:MAG: hypothetical protein ACFFD4_24360 [Candidatus Odinarchaeota archaeon]